MNSYSCDIIFMLGLFPLHLFRIIICFNSQICFILSIFRLSTRPLFKQLSRGELSVDVFALQPVANCFNYSSTLDFIYKKANLNSDCLLSVVLTANDMIRKVTEKQCSGVTLFCEDKFTQTTTLALSSSLTFYQKMRWLLMLAKRLRKFWNGARFKSEVKTI